MTPEYWDEAKAYLSKKDKKLKCIIESYEGEMMVLRGDAFYTLARSIVGQQIPVKAADSIWKRVCEGVGKIKPQNVADTDAAAQRIAQAAYPRWRHAMEYLWQRSGVPFTLSEIYPTDFAGLQKIGHGVAGSPATVRDYIAKLESEAGINYALCQMVFGDMNFADASHSIRLFAREVMPAFA